MALTNEQLAELATELANDPKNLGYAGTSHPEAATLLNTVGLSNETIPNQSVSIHAVRDEIGSGNTRLTEWGNLSQGKRDLIGLLFSNGDMVIDITNNLIVQQILSVFTAGGAPETRAALIALGSRPATRGEVLFGANVNITTADVMEARQL